MRRASVSWILGIVLVASACAQDDDGAAPSTSLPDSPSIEQLGHALGCSVEPVKLIADRFGFSDTADCADGGSFVARVHTVPSQFLAEMPSYFAARYGPFKCPDGSEGGTIWPVLGDGWVVVTPTRREADTVAARLGGEVLTEMSQEGPPVSYMYPVEGLCPGSQGSASTSGA